MYMYKANQNDYQLASDSLLHVDGVTNMDDEKEQHHRFGAAAQKRKITCGQTDDIYVEQEKEEGRAFDDMFLTFSPAAAADNDYSDDNDQQQIMRSDEDNDDDEEAKETIFPTKLFTMLHEAESKGFTDVVSWGIHGNTFRVHKRSDFERVILPKYFKMTKYKSFTRQLTNYCFGSTNKGPETGEYFNAGFTFNRYMDPNTCHKIARRPRKNYRKKSRTGTEQQVDERRQNIRKQRASPSKAHAKLETGQQREENILTSRRLLQQDNVVSSSSSEQFFHRLHNKKPPPPSTSDLNKQYTNLSSSNDLFEPRTIEEMIAFPQLFPPFQLQYQQF